VEFENAKIKRKFAEYIYIVILVNATFGKLIENIQ